MNTPRQLLSWKYIARAPAVYAAPAPVVKYIARAPAVYAAPAPVVECIDPAPAVSYATLVPLQYAVPVHHAAPTMIVTEVVVSRDDNPDVLQQPQVGYAASMQNGAPVQYGGPVRYAVCCQTESARGNLLT